MNIFIRVTNKCNLHCKHCFNNEDNTNCNFVDIKNFLEKINKENKDNLFIIHGGEPMLSSIDDIGNLISSFNKNKWQISTNICYKITQDIINIFEKVSYIRISFDVGIRFRNIKNILLWYKNIKFLSKNFNKKIYLNICLSKQLIKHTPEQILHMINKLNINNVQFFQIVKTNKNESIIPTNKETDLWLCKLYDCIKYFPKINCENFCYIKNKILNKPDSYYCLNCCHNSLTINTNGTIINCPGNNDIIGTIKDDPKIIINKIKNIKYKAPNKCLTCRHYNKCKGWCRNLQYDKTSCPYPINLSNKIEKDYDFTFI